MDVTRACPCCGHINKWGLRSLIARMLKVRDSAYMEAITDRTGYHAGYCEGLEKARELIEAVMNDPAQEPLEWEEIPDHRLVWMELRGIDKPIPSILRQVMDDQAWYTMESGCVFTFAMEEMGKRWRAWAVLPTDEERSAAEWM